MNLEQQHFTVPRILDKIHILSHIHGSIFLVPRIKSHEFIHRHFFQKSPTNQPLTDTLVELHYCSKKLLIKKLVIHATYNMPRTQIGK